MTEKEPFENRFPFMRVRRPERGLAHTYTTQGWRKEPGQLPDDFPDRPWAISQIITKED